MTTFPVEAEKVNRLKNEKKAVDIGFPAARLSRSEETKLRIEQQKKLKNNPEIEKLSRHLKRKQKQFHSVPFEAMNCFLNWWNFNKFSLQ